MEQARDIELDVGMLINPLDLVGHFIAKAGWAFGTDRNELR